MATKYEDAIKLQVYKAWEGDFEMPKCSRCKKETGNWCDVCKQGLCSECEKKHRVCEGCEKVPKSFCDGPSCNNHAKWKCGNCHKRGYCSRDCQRNDWGSKFEWHGNHKAVCGKDDAA
jgi:hypothetical protein